MPRRASAPIYKGRKSGNLSTIGCTSFFPSKPLGCYGDGGAIFTDDAVLANACREIRVHGQRGRYDHTRIGVGGRMDTLQCAVVLAKLERFDWEIERRLQAGRRYAALLAPLAPRVRLLKRKPTAQTYMASTPFASPLAISCRNGLKPAGYQLRCTIRSRSIDNRLTPRGTTDNPSRWPNA